MKKFVMISVVAAILSCLSLTTVQAEKSAAAPRKFKTWTVEDSKASTSKTTNSTAQWKKNLAAKAAEKQAATQAQTKATQQIATTKQAASTTAKTAVTKQAAVSKPTAALPSARTPITTQTTTTKSSTSTARTTQPSVNANKSALKKAAQAKEKKLKASKLTTTTSSKKAGGNKNASSKMSGSNVAYNDNWHTKTTQQKLRQLGYLNESATGKMTSATKSALEKFQADHDLKKTGKLDEATYRKVEWVVFSKNGIKNLNGTTVVREAAKYKGVKYVFGGTTPKGFDCSGYVQYVFKQLHATVTRTADTQALEGVFVTQKQLKPGDLVFFSTYEPGASHVGIYAGSGRFWNATSSRGIALCGLQEDYWRTRYYGARRVLVSNGETNK